jgi:hypothetical protein
MPDERRIPPGILPRSAADYLTAVGQTAMESKRRLDAMATPEGDRFPALLTDSDDSYDPVRVLWTEQTYDANGQRYEMPNGRQGTATWMPAFAVGGGTLPAEGAWGDGIEVELRRRLVAIDPDTVDSMGPVYEFDTGGGSDVSLVETQTSGDTPPAGYLDA